MDRKILIVDDDIDTLQLVGTMLERQGFKIVAANNGQQAVQKAEAESPDLIILDVMMPGMDGYEVTRKLRAMDKTAYIPIIMFTAKSQVDDKVEGFESGVDDYLTKPTHPTELISRVKAILERQPTAPAGSASAESAPPPIANAELIGVIGAKGGLGVSTLAINLAVGIYQKTKEYVTLAEMRPGQSDISIYLGYSNTHMLGELLKRNPKEIRVHDVEEALITHGTGIQLLLASIDPEDVVYAQAVDQIGTILSHMTRLAPYTLVDLGNGLSDANRKVLQMCTKVIVVVEPIPPVILQTEGLIKSIKALDIASREIFPVIVNRQRLDVTIPASEIEIGIGMKPVAVLPPAPELAYQAAVRHEPMITQQPDSLVAQQLKKFIEHLTRKE